MFAALSGVLWLTASAATAPATPPGPGEAPGVEVLAWSPRPFAALVLDDPDLAACFTKLPGSWALARTPRQAIDGSALVPAISSRLAGLVDPERVGRLRVTATGADRNAASVVVHGGSALLLLPDAQLSDLNQIAGVVAEAVVASQLRAAAPDPRCGEPVLALSEALVRAGALALAALPPSLRPVSDWLDPKRARPPLDAMARDALDRKTPWLSRRAYLAQASRAGSVRPELAHAAAVLVETLGPPRRLLERPYELLLAWRDTRSDALPPLPAPLRKALARPLEAGQPDDDETADREALAASVAERVAATGTAAGRPLPASAPLQARLRQAALERVSGTPGLCGRLTAGELPPGIFTGCRDEESPGLVFSRPGSTGGFEVVWWAQGGGEALLLEWPQWILHPQLCRDRAALVFLDPRGIWRASTDGGTPPELVLGGAFRHLACSPDGRALAALRRDSGSLVVLTPSGQAQEVPVSGNAGLAWLDSDVVVVSTGRGLDLASGQGGVRSDLVALPCSGALAARGSRLLAAVHPPCEAGVWRVSVAEGSATRALKLPEGPAGLVALPDGSAVLATPEGLWRWNDGTPPERITHGLTPGPG